MFLAESVRWSVGNVDEIDLGRVPEYYRTHAAQVFGWFLLRMIRQIQFDDSIAQRFGDKTLIRLDTSVDERSDKVAASASASNKSCLLHLSDLHFGADYAFIPQNEQPVVGDLRTTLTQSLGADLDRIGLRSDIAAVIVTGDFTTAGDWHDGTRKQLLQEFEALRAELGLKQEQIVAVPGNHDIVRYPPGAAVRIEDIAVDNQTTYQHEREFRTFVDELIGRSWKESLNYVRRISLRSADILICVLNSCTIVATEWTEYGFVGNSGLDAISKLKTDTIVRPSYKFVALHHHLLPVVQVEAPNSKGVTLTLDASALLDAAQQAGVHVAIHGHQHMPRLARYQTIPLMAGTPAQPLHVISNGSTGGTRRPGSERNTYCVFRLEHDKAFLWMRELRTDSKAGASLFEGTLDIRPEQPVGC
jgi:3',5'-cyclic AMP phosphodiesterase CpdA